MRTLLKVFFAFALSVMSLSAQAQLTLRLDPEMTDPGTSALPARLGYANQNGKASGALQLALTYNLASMRAGSDAVVEPYVALAINDNATVNTDKKSLELGLRSTVGDIASGRAWLLDAAIAKVADRAVGSNGHTIKAAAELVDMRLKYGLGHVPHRGGLFIRPKLGLYYLKTQATDSPLGAPLGSASGAWFEIAVDMFPPFSARTRMTYKGKFAHDVGSSGDRVKSTYRKHGVSIEYLLYNYGNPPKGTPLFSIVLDRSIGNDAIEGQPLRKASTGIYLGVKL